LHIILNFLLGFVLLQGKRAKAINFKHGALLLTDYSLKGSVIIEKNFFLIPFLIPADFGIQTALEFRETLSFIALILIVITTVIYMNFNLLVT